MYITLSLTFLDLIRLDEKLGELTDDEIEEKILTHVKNKLNKNKLVGELNDVQWSVYDDNFDK